MGNDEVFMKIGDVATRYKVTRDAVHKWVRQGSFPPGVHFGRAHRWPLSQIKAWEAERLNESARIHEAAAV